MNKYAIIDKSTKIAQNIISADENFLSSFPLNDDEVLVSATRSVQIGMIYDETNQNFPEVYELDRVLDVRYEAQNLAVIHRSLLTEATYLTEEQKQVHEDYIRNLGKLNEIETYDEITQEFELLKTPPEFPPKPREITQEVFRGVLKLTEKILWDNPETGTTQQSAVINTLKMDFPHYGVESMGDELELLEQVGFFTAERVTEVTQALS